MSKVSTSRPQDGPPAPAEGPVPPSNLAAISHEIRTPLTGIRGAAQLLAGTGLSDEQARLVAMILTSSDALMRLLNDLLDVSKIEAGQWQLDVVTFALRRFLDDAVTAWRPAAWEKGLRIRLDVEPGCPDQVEGDRGRLRQVLDNLIGNALKFTARGSISLRVRPVAGEAGTMLRLAVRDTGIGIPPEQAAQLFQPYRQGSAATGSRYGGSGLGLSICRGLIRQMGGEIGIDSVPGSGTTVWFTLPCAGCRVAPEAAAPADRKPLRLLLVEDHPVNQMVLTAMLERLGHSVDLAGDGTAAIAAVRDGSYDAVLMDIQLPQLDGIAATRAIRALGGDAARTRVVALTADAMPADRDRLLAAGLDDYLGKPIDPAALLAALDRCRDPETTAGDAHALLSSLAARAEGLAE